MAWLIIEKVAPAQEVKTRCRGEIAVVTLPSLHGQKINDVAMRIGRTWGVGFRGAPSDPATQTGVVLLLAPNDGRVWIATSDRSRVFITDTDAALISQVMRSYFIKKRYGAGVRLGLDAIANRFATRFGFALAHHASADWGKPLRLNTVPGFMLDNNLSRVLPTW